MFLAFGLNGCLAQKTCTLSKLSVALIVQIDAVRHDHDGGTVQRRLQQMRIEHHG